MNIIVPIKQVPETELRVKIAGDGRSLDLSGVKMVVQPRSTSSPSRKHCSSREKAGEGTVTAITVGDADATQALRTALAMGADEGDQDQGGGRAPAATASRSRRC